MKRKIRVITISCALSMAFAQPVMAAGEVKIEEAVPSVGVAAILEEEKAAEEYIEAAKSSAVYGYNNVGVAKVENHLNIREGAGTDTKLVGKLPKNGACEILEEEGDWLHIKSGEVEGYVHKDYMYTGMEARLVAEQVVETVAVATSGGLRVRKGPSTDSEIITQMGEGEALEVVEAGEEWIEVLVDAETAYISAEYAEVKRELQTAVTITEFLYGEGVTDVRMELCEYAKQFVGNPYVYGGTSLTNGADCSGFTLTLMGKYGVKLPHSARAQSKMGTHVDLEDIRPGDLVFYSSEGSVNHVALYIGNNQVVHASNPKNGIRLSKLHYRTINNVRSFLAD